MADLTMMVLFDTSVRDLLHATPAFLAGHIRWTLGFMVVAVLTSSIAAFALAIIGTVVAFALTAVVVVSMAVLKSGRVIELRYLHRERPHPGSRRARHLRVRILGRHRLSGPGTGAGHVPFSSSPPASPRSLWCRHNGHGRSYGRRSPIRVPGPATRPARPQRSI